MQQDYRAFSAGELVIKLAEKKPAADTMATVVPYIKQYPVTLLLVLLSTLGFLLVEFGDRSLVSWLTIQGIGASGNLLQGYALERVSPAQFFGTAGNLGIPVADDNNKYFTSAEGYNLTLTWQGDYNASTSYSAGDVVRIRSKIQNPAKSGTANKQEDVVSRPDSLFVCIKAASNKDPRFELSYWRRDQCAKNLEGCTARYAKYGSDYKRGLPFGGFPSIERYRF